MQTNEIIELAEKIKKNYGNDPIQICNELGICINYIHLNPKCYQAYTLCISDKPIINLNDKFTYESQKVLCAHELGHAIMHTKNLINQFNDDSNGIYEYEANLFAVCLLFDKNDFNLDICKMDNYLLKGILDINIELKA